MLLLLALLVGVVGSATPAAAVVPGQNGLIAFERSGSGLSDVYTVTAKGEKSKKAKKLTNSPAADQAPAWSPDGKKIAFGSTRDDNVTNEIYVIDANGANQTRLTNNTSIDSFPEWSPDGTKIAFNSDRDASFAQFDIFIMDADGGHQTNLTHGAADGTTNAQPAWSPDGTKIVFARNAPLKVRQLFVMNADGSGRKQITKKGGGSPDWPT